MSSPFKVVTSSDGLEIYADAVGNPANPCIVMIHGLSLSAAVFDNIFKNPKFSADHYLVRYDMRGHGRSGKPTSIEGYSSKLYADDYAAVAKTFQVKSAVLVGWSMGATVAVDVTSYLPTETLRGVVYLSGLTYIGPIMNEVGSPTILGMLPGLTTTSDVNLSLTTRYEFAESLFDKPDTIPFEVKCSWMGMTMLQPPEATGFVISRPQDPTKLFDLGKAGLPLHVVHGDKDKQVYGEVVIDDIKKNFKEVSVFWVKGGGHAVHYEEPDAVMGSIIDFTKTCFSK